MPPEILEAVNRQLSPEDAAVAVGKILLDAGSNEQAVREIIDFMSPKMAALSVKALRDVMAAKLFLERADKFTDQRETLKRRLAAAIDVTPNTQFFPTGRENAEES